MANIIKMIKLVDSAKADKGKNSAKRSIMRVIKIVARSGVLVLSLIFPKNFGA